MTHPFELSKEIEIAASPEEVWEAITTGPGIDGWFLGTGNEVDPRLGGRVRISFGEAGAGESTITAWEPMRRFAHQGDPAPDGTLHAFEYVIEARAGGSVVVRLVHSGLLADDWETEYDALDEGDLMYLHLLAQYILHFRGRPTTTVTLWKGEEPERDRVLATFRRGLGLGDEVSEGDVVILEPEGLGSLEGVIDFVSSGIIGVRTDDALLRFLHSPQGVAYLGHHLYGDDIDATAAATAWQGWLDRAFEAGEEAP
jgi:uncharacterized protein YndB with AHSA1/START domain